MSATAKKLNSNGRSNVTQLHTRRPTTLEMVRLCCPNSAQIESIQRAFGVECQDGDIILQTVSAHLLDQMDIFKDFMNEKALEIHFQRIVGAYVGSAYGSGQFYTQKVSEAREATAKLANELRDEDREGPAGFDSDAQRKRDFAAALAAQAHQLLMAAEGAAASYSEFFGKAWEPFESAQPASVQSVSREAAATQLAAFG